MLTKQSNVWIIVQIAVSVTFDHLAQLKLHTYRYILELKLLKKKALKSATHLGKTVEVMVTRRPG